MCSNIKRENSTIVFTQISTEENREIVMTARRQNDVKSSIPHTDAVLAALTSFS